MSLPQPKLWLHRLSGAILASTDVSPSAEINSMQSRCLMMMSGHKLEFILGQHKYCKVQRLGFAFSGFGVVMALLSKDDTSGKEGALSH